MIAVIGIRPAHLAAVMIIAVIIQPCGLRDLVPIEGIGAVGFIHVEGVEVTNRTISVTYPNGAVSTLNFELGIQQMSPGQTGVDYGVMNIASFGFDVDDPLVMLPDAAGTSSSTAFGDALYTGFADGWEEHSVHVLWGGTWDLRTSCGLFCYRFLARDMDNFRENASRMMFYSFEELRRQVSDNG